MSEQEKLEQEQAGVNNPFNEAVKKLTSDLDKYERLVLPRLLEHHNISPAQFVQVILTEVKRSDKLLEAYIANPFSMYASILHAAQIGLLPNSQLQEYFLIPRNIKNKKTGKHVLTVVGQLGYRGVINILTRSGLVTRIHTECVYEGDVFEAIYGLNPDIIHKPDFAKPRTQDKLTHVYAVAKLKNGEYQFVVLTRKDIENIRKLSPYENSLYFNDTLGITRWLEKKCAIFQLDKMLPKDYYSRIAMETDRRVQGGATFELGENNEVKIVNNDVKLVEGAPVRPTRFRNLYNGSLAMSADLINATIETQEHPIGNNLNIEPVSLNPSVNPHTISTQPIPQVSTESVPPVTTVPIPRISNDAKSGTKNKVKNKK